VIAVTIAGFLALFALTNVYTYRTLVRLHPRRRPFVIALVVICNVIWPLLPILQRGTAAARILRSIFGPPWFAWLCFVLLYSAFLWSAAACRRLLIRDKERRQQVAALRVASRFFLWTTLIASIVGVYQALVPLRIERVPIAIGAPARIVEMSDLHVGLFTRPSRLKKIFSTAVSLQPDAIVLAGDLIDDDPYFIPKLLEAANHVPPHIPIYAVLGNHEIYGDPGEVIRRLRGSRIRLLVNEGAPLGNAWIAGISDFAARTPELKPDMTAALARRQGRIPIVLAHQPKAFDEARRLSVPLTICAHTHGGQCGIRPLRWSLAGVFLPFHMGLYERGASKLYVNTGTGYWLLPWRLGMTPEITVLELR
jgi:predicted MPP superfamily phosphohydrolase